MALNDTKATAAMRADSASANAAPGVATKKIGGNADGDDGGSDRRGARGAVTRREVLFIGVLTLLAGIGIYVLVTAEAPVAPSIAATDVVELAVHIEALNRVVNVRLQASDTIAVAKRAVEVALGKSLLFALVREEFGGFGYHSRWRVPDATTLGHVASTSRFMHRDVATGVISLRLEYMSA